MGRNLKGQHIYTPFGLTLVALGIVLLAAGSTYFVYSWRAHASLDNLNITASETAGETEFNSLINQRNIVPGDSPVTSGSGEPGSSLKLSTEAIAAQILYPGEVLSPSSWGNPLLENDILELVTPLLEGFQPVSPDLIPALGTLPAPTRISILSIGVESEVQGLQILDLGDSRAYETPKNVVGHIPETAGAGEKGTAWFFGHLESPIRGEGNVFANLPQIPDLLRQGGEVYATVESDETTYLYRLMASEVVHQDDLAIHDTGSASISLVACVPRFVYDYRLVVTGELVGIKQVS